MFLWGLVLLAASFVIESFTQKTNTQRPASLNQLTLPQADEGTPQSVCFGDCWTSDWTVLWYGNLRNQGVHGSSSSGGKK